METLRKDEAEVEVGEQVPLKEKPKVEDSKSRVEERLDKAVEESFPASDPVSVQITKI